jgi:hypothetical protein
MDIRFNASAITSDIILLCQISLSCYTSWFTLSFLFIFAVFDGFLCSYEPSRTAIANVGVLIADFQTFIDKNATETFAYLW